MTTHLIGSTTTNGFVAIPFFKGQGSIPPADLATIANGIKNDNAANKVVPGSFPVGGPLYFPKRGFLRVLEGDIVFLDSAGFPYIVPANSITSGGWTYA